MMKLSFLDPRIPYRLAVHFLASQLIELRLARVSLWPFTKLEHTVPGVAITF